MPEATHEARHWRALAARATAAASQITELNTRMTMLRIAVGYEQLAREAESREAHAESKRGRGFAEGAQEALEPADVDA